MRLVQPGTMSRPLSRDALLAMQHANYADDLDLPAEAAGWTSEEAEAFFASGGAVCPAWTGAVRRLAEGSGVPSPIAEQLIALRMTPDIMMDASVAQLKLYASEAGSTLGALLHMRLAAERGVAAPSSELDGEHVERASTDRQPDRQLERRSSAQLAGDGTAGLQPAATHANPT